MNEETYLLRFAATDWDREIVKAINQFLQTVEPDSEGTSPQAFVDQPINGWLGVHVFPLNMYPKARRDEIVHECARIWDDTIQGPASPSSRR